METRLFIGRRKGRPHLRWMDDVVAALKVMKIKQWMEKMKDRNGDKTVYRKKETKTSFEMDGRCGSRLESNEDKAVDGEDER